MSYNVCSLFQDVQRSINSILIRRFKEMKNGNYRVVFSGKLAEGEKTESVAIKLANLFHLDLNNHDHAAKLAKLLSTKSVVIKQGLTKQTALNYQKAMAQIGAICMVEDMSQLQAGSKPQVERRRKQRRCHQLDRRKARRTSAILPDRRSTNGRRSTDHFNDD